MPKSDRLAGLTEEEREEYNAWKSNPAYSRPPNYTAPELRHLESLAASRASDARKLALLEKHEWAGWHEESEGRQCLECFEIEIDGHKPDCALAAELEGGE